MDEKLIKSLKDLNNFRSAPSLMESQCKKISDELNLQMKKASWFTVGIMAPSADQSLFILRQLEEAFNWSSMELLESTNEDGPVFLKANQNSGEIRIRLEQGLGEGILISGHHEDPSEPSNTWGPLPLDFFKK